MSPILEKQGILRDVPGRRPGDVTLPVWRNDRGLAIDVAVTSPFSSSGMRSKAPADAYALNFKHRKYDAGFVRSGYYFSAQVELGRRASAR